MDTTSLESISAVSTEFEDVFLLNSAILHKNNDFIFPTLLG